MDKYNDNFAFFFWEMKDNSSKYGLDNMHIAKVIVCRQMWRQAVSLTLISKTI